MESLCDVNPKVDSGPLWGPGSVVQSVPHSPSSSALARSTGVLECWAPGVVAGPGQEGLSPWLCPLGSDPHLQGLKAYTISSPVSLLCPVTLGQMAVVLAVVGQASRTGSLSLWRPLWWGAQHGLLEACLRSELRWRSRRCWPLGWCSAPASRSPRMS